MKKFIILTLVILINMQNLLAIDFISGEPVDLLTRPKGFLPTGADNSLERDDDLFQFSGNIKNRILSTESTQTNIHNHFKNGRASRLSNYTYTGEMRIDSTDAGIGFTFHSQYPESDTYYRIRRFSGSPTFHVRSHPDGYELDCTSSDSQISPEINKWYKFRVVVSTTNRQTRFRSKIWEKGQDIPNQWQIDCKDQSETRIKKGKPGVWSMGDGIKNWRKLRIVAR
jgi:hypothetical protein